MTDGRDEAGDGDKVKILEMAVDVRKFEIGLFWQRSLFFWGFIAATFLAYANIKDQNVEVRFAIICAGVIFSFGWTLVNRGSKYWQEAWEQKVHRVEHDVLNVHLFWDRETVEPKFWLWQAREYSVSKLTIALSDFTLLVWLFLAAKSILAAGTSSLVELSWLSSRSPMRFSCSGEAEPADRGRRNVRPRVRAEALSQSRSGRNGGHSRRYVDTG